MTAERRSADTREKVLAVAETEFARKGYAGAHLQAIAEAVGVQKTALYYYFPSKEAIFIAVVSRMMEDFDRCITASTERDLPHRERFLCLVDDVNDLMAERPNYSQMLIRIFVDRAASVVPLEPIIRSVIESLLRFYREGVEAGTFRKMSSRHFFQTLLGSVVFHYAARDFSALLLGIDDIFAGSAVAWRRDELSRMLAHGVLMDSEPEEPGR